MSAESRRGSFRCVGCWRGQGHDGVKQGDSGQRSKPAGLVN